MRPRFCPTYLLLFACLSFGLILPAFAAGKKRKDAPVEKNSKTKTAPKPEAKVADKSARNNAKNNTRDKDNGKDKKEQLAKNKTNEKTKGKDDPKDKAKAKKEIVVAKKSTDKSRDANKDKNAKHEPELKNNKATAKNSDQKKDKAGAKKSAPEKAKNTAEKNSKARATTQAKPAEKTVAKAEKTTEKKTDKISADKAPNESLLAKSLKQAAAKPSNTEKNLATIHSKDETEIKQLPTTKFTLRPITKVTPKVELKFTLAKALTASFDPPPPTEPAGPDVIEVIEHDSPETKKLEDMYRQEVRPLNYSTIPNVSNRKIDIKKMDGDRITQIQEALQKRGYYQGEITGIYDDVTVEAMRRFQSTNKIDVTGYATAHTLKLLGLTDWERNYE